MPRRRRAVKQRRDTLRFECLGIVDYLSLTSGWSPPLPGDVSTTKLITMADVREAWKLNRHIFMELCTCDVYRSPAYEHREFRRHPGERPWAWWKFEQGMEHSPPKEEQPAILERLGELSGEERKLLAQRKR